MHVYVFVYVRISYLVVFPQVSDSGKDTSYQRMLNLILGQLVCSHNTLSTTHTEPVGTCFKFLCNCFTYQRCFVFQSLSLFPPLSLLRVSTAAIALLRKAHIYELLANLQQAVDK